MTDFQSDQLDRGRNRPPDSKHSSDIDYTTAPLPLYNPLSFLSGGFNTRSLYHIIAS